MLIYWSTVCHLLKYTVWLLKSNLCVFEVLSVHLFERSVWCLKQSVWFAKYNLSERFLKHYGLTSKHSHCPLCVHVIFKRSLLAFETQYVNFLKHSLCFFQAVYVPRACDFWSTVNVFTGVQSLGILKHSFCASRVWFLKHSQCVYWNRVSVSIGAESVCLLKRSQCVYWSSQCILDVCAL